MSEPVRHIVFDIGKVLIHYDPELAYLDLIPDAAERRHFLDKICSPAWNIEQDRGRSWQDGEALLIAKYPDQANHIRAFRVNWHKMVPFALSQAVFLFEALLMQGRDVTLLTNFAADTFREAQKRFDFLCMSRGVTVSGDVGYLKPQHEIYDLHVKAFGLLPAATLFIDDSLPNVEGAIAAGWQGLHFTDASQLQADLIRLGITL